MKDQKCQCTKRQKEIKSKEKKDNDIQSKCVGVLHFSFTIKGLHHDQAGRWTNAN